MVARRAVGARDAIHEIDPAVVAELGYRLACPGVDGKQVAFVCSPQHPLILSVGPVGNTPRVEPDTDVRVRRQLAERALGSWTHSVSPVAASIAAA